MFITIMHFHYLFQILVITPQNLGDDVIYLLGQTKLKHLHILQNR